MSALHNAFLLKLPPGARVLDAGCGSGRDARHSESFVPWQNPMYGKQA
jgi:ubiquinone/menaquinone biosynthesis C-methylase UbiE